MAKYLDAALTQHQDVSGKADKSQIGAAGGIAPLGQDMLIDPKYLPSYVDDVVEGYIQGGKLFQDAQHKTPTACSAGKIYVDLTDGADSKIYRWSGTQLVPISDVPGDVTKRLSAVENQISDVNDSINSLGDQMDEKTDKSEFNRIENITYELQDDVQSNGAKLEKIDNGATSDSSLSFAEIDAAIK